VEAGKSSVFFRYMDGIELSLCVACNRIARRRAVELLFIGASRLGDGMFWYALIIALPVIYGTGALPVSMRMVTVGLVGVALYKVLKASMVRHRPFITHAAIHQGTAPLDRYGFPSGHTLHAVAFSTTALSAYPELGWILVPFAALVAASRMVLGLHYPSDVVAGAAIGFGLARAVSAL